MTEEEANPQFSRASCLFNSLREEEKKMRNRSGGKARYICSHCSRLPSELSGVAVQLLLPDQRPVALTCLSLLTFRLDHHVGQTLRTGRRYTAPDQLPGINGRHRAYRQSTDGRVNAIRADNEVILT